MLLKLSLQHCKIQFRTLPKISSNHANKVLYLTTQAKGGHLMLLPFVNCGTARRSLYYLYFKILFSSETTHSFHVRFF